LSFKKSHDSTMYSILNVLMYKGIMYCNVMYRRNATLCIKKKNIYYMSKKKEKSWLKKISSEYWKYFCFWFYFEVASGAEMGPKSDTLSFIGAFRSEVFC